jgi:hypothetical protein
MARDFPMQVAALKAALCAWSEERYDTRRREDVFDCVTVLTNTLCEAGVAIETVIIYTRDLIRESAKGTDVLEDALIQHCIKQYFR